MFQDINDTKNNWFYTNILKATQYILVYMESWGVWILIPKKYKLLGPPISI